MYVASQTFTPPPGEVCSGDTATSRCSTSTDFVEWYYNDKLVALLDGQDNIGTTTTTVDGVNFKVTLSFQSSSLTTSNISFTVTPATDGKIIRCNGRSISSSATIHVVTDGRSL